MSFSGFSCIHTHTTFCDGHDDVETFCQTAYEKGLVSLGFSAHAPIPKSSGIINSCNMPEERVEKYMEEILAAKKRWSGKLPVYLGLEVEFIEGITSPADLCYQELDLDYIIGAVHYITAPNGNRFVIDGPPDQLDKDIQESFGGDPAGLVEAYFNAMVLMIRAGGFDFLAHPDLIRKNNTALTLAGKPLFRESDETYRNHITALAALMGKTGIVAELNTGGLIRGKTSECYPSLEFLKLLREQGVSMVINADAHRARSLGGHYEDASHAMLAAGYTEHLLFEGRENDRAVWKRAEF